MKKILSYPLSVLYYFFFLLTILIFHPIQWICFNAFGYQAHKKSVDAFNWCLLRCLNILGTQIVFENKFNFTKDRPHIIVANHQSLYDISPLIWYFRKLHPKFISKVELGKGIPSISYNLRHGGSILIDRKNPRQALPEIKKFGNYLNKTKHAAVIFPEGTRSRDGKPKSFSPNGLKMLFKICPEALIVPVTINNSWKLQKSGNFPLNIGIKLVCTVQEPIFVEQGDVDAVIKKVEDRIKNNIHY